MRSEGISVLGITFRDAGEVFESSVGRQGLMPRGILCPPVLGVNYFFKPIWRNFRTTSGSGRNEISIAGLWPATLIGRALELDSLKF